MPSAPPRTDGPGGGRAQTIPEESLKALAHIDQGPDDILKPQHIPLAERVSSWLTSLSIHVVLMILLALILFPGKPAPIEVEAIFSEHLGDQLDVFTLDEGNLNPTKADSYAIEVPDEFKIDDMLVKEKERLPFVENAAGNIFEQSRIEIRDMLSGRTDPGTKNDLLSKYGGNKLTIDAVRAGLAWLARQQDRVTGSWSLKGPYESGRRQENRQAATGMALLAFQGDGNTRSFGDHAQTVRRGWTWLLRQQKTNGAFVDDDVYDNDRFYTQAICTISLCELLAMEKRIGNGKTDTESLRYAAVKAVDYLLASQSRTLGGWRYQAQIESDLSVTGWCLMALQTARMADIPIPAEAFERVTKFLDSVAYNDGSQYAYQKFDGELKEKRPSMTATGLLCRMYLGWDRKNPAIIKGADTLIEPQNLIRFPKEEGNTRNYNLNAYGWYSTSMVLKHLGPYSKHWRTWNKAMCDQLPTHQVPRGKKEAGSWNPDLDEYGLGGGRLYVTCLSILCLEVYYRHLGIFRN